MLLPIQDVPVTFTFSLRLNEIKMVPLSTIWEANDRIRGFTFVYEFGLILKYNVTILYIIIVWTEDSKIVEIYVSISGLLERIRVSPLQLWYSIYNAEPPMLLNCILTII